MEALREAQLSTDLNTGLLSHDFMSPPYELPPGTFLDRWYE
jgi:hypothetical protein